MTETPSPRRPLVVEEGKSSAASSGRHPRKETSASSRVKRLLRRHQRHEMGSSISSLAYAHAPHQVRRLSKALQLDGVYGTLTGTRSRSSPIRSSSSPRLRARTSRLRAGRRQGPPRRRPGGGRRGAHPRAGPRRGGDVEVDYEPLPVLLDGEEALKDEVVLHDDAGSNTVWSGCSTGATSTPRWPTPTMSSGSSACTSIAFRRHRSSAQAASSSTTGGTGQWTIYGNHQMPGVGAIWMAPALRTGIDKLRFVSQDIGGGFGNKITLHRSSPPAACWRGS